MWGVEGVTSYGYETFNGPILTRESFLWSSQTQSWDIVNTHPIDQCEYYAVCGVNSNCNINDLPICVCLQGFIPKYHAKWDSHDWSGGCVRRKKI